MRAILICMLGLLLVHCASAPSGRFSVDRLRLVGVKRFDEAALASCLLTVERERFGLTIGVRSERCNVPPFDGAALRLDLIQLPWTDYPVLNPAVVDVDARRIERWYRARGFYDAKVVRVQYAPQQASGAGFDASVPGESGKGQGCDPKQDACEAVVTLTIEEGEPLLVSQVRVRGAEQVAPQLMVALGALPQIQVGARFDEVPHDAYKVTLKNTLMEHGYADAKVSATIELDHAVHGASLDYRLVLGPRYRFGSTWVLGQGGLPAEPVVAAADVAPGTLFQHSVLSQVQHAVYGLGAYSAVDVTVELDKATHLAHLQVKVTPLPEYQFRLGVGVMSGAMQRTGSGALQSISQWDLHLSGSYELRHVFGSLGRLRIEDKPRLIFPKQFPAVDSPALGNVLQVRLNQPGVLEARTDWIMSARWDYGPDPNLEFARSELVFRTELKRHFLGNLLRMSMAVQHDRYFLHETIPSSAAGDAANSGQAHPSSYRYSYLEQSGWLDLRDRSQQPRKGALLGLVANQALLIPAMSDWSMIKLQGDFRGYVPLPLSMVLAGRFAIAANWIIARAQLSGFDSNGDSGASDGRAHAMGPSSYQLRGGGAQSNRGYVAGTLGSLSGEDQFSGVRRWEASLELRVRLGELFGAVLFCDLGDVNAEPAFRFGAPHPSLGFGLRYLTPVGSLRFDVGVRTADRSAAKLPWTSVPGAFHLTLGEAF